MNSSFKNPDQQLQQLDISEFSVNLLQNIAQKKQYTPQNILFSPYMIFVNILMSYTIASDKVRSQIAQSLNMPLNELNNLNFYHQTQDLINSQSNYITINHASSQWVPETISFYPRFEIEQNKLYFDSNWLDSIDSINQWIKLETNNNISSMIKQQKDIDFSKFLLTSAIFFKAKWADSFNPSNTYIDYFYPYNQIPKQTFFMEQYKFVNCVQGHIYNVIELNYQGNLFSMVIVLPYENQQWENFLSSIHKGFFEELNKKLAERHTCKTHIVLPKFALEYSQNLEQIKIEDVDTFIHKSKIEVDETGNEPYQYYRPAINTKEIVILDTPVQYFSATRPFLFYIRDKKYNNIYQVGTYTQPPEYINIKNDI